MKPQTKLQTGSSRTPKVCIFTSVHRPFDVRVFHRQAKSLAAAGYAVTLWVHADFNIKHQDGVTLKGLSRPRNRLARLLNVIKLGRRCRSEDADVYHFHDLELLPVGVWLKIVTGKTVFYDCHENYPEAAYERAWYPDWLKPWLARFIAWIEPTLARRLDRIICVVPDQQERFLANGCSTELIRNLPRIEMFSHAYNAHPPKKSRLIYLGGLSMVRGARILVDIMERIHQTHPHVKLLCVGPFNEPHVEREVKSRIVKKGLDDVIQHIPFVPHETVPDYLVRSLIGLIPWQPNQQMLRMVFPNKVFEYMSCGLPIVASNLPSLEHLLKRSDAGILAEPCDPDDHARAICRLLDNPDQARTLGHNGYRFVHADYNWNTEAKKLLRVYREHLLSSEWT
jgi:glycosyltransferase involved in cell wall biosynthesis